MKTSILTFFFFLIYSFHNFISAQASSGCRAPEQSQFDFWIGNWNCISADTLEGTDIITRQLDSCIVQENFSDLKNAHKGWSWTIFNLRDHVWQQTYISNDGLYLYLSGGMKNDSMILSTHIKTKTGVMADYRILFYNIKNDHFDWSWDLSLDGGKSWTPKWKVRYERITG